MARSPITASKEGEATSAAEETLHFDDDNLRAIAEVYKNEGNDEYKKNNFNNAIQFYTEGIKVNCKDEELNAILYSNRAAARFNLGNYTETLDDAKIAVGLRPSFLKAFVRGASACVQLKKFDEAITWCNKGLAIDPNNQKLLGIRSWSMKEKSKLQGSHQEKKIDTKGTYKAGIDNFDDRSREGKEYGTVGLPHRHMGGFDTAIGNLERCLRIAKELGDRLGEGVAYDSLGSIYLNLGDFKSAIDNYERYLKIAKELCDRSREAKAYGNLGIAHRKLGDFKTAIDCHECRLKISKELGDRWEEGAAYCSLGNAHRNLGDVKTAIDFYESFLEMTKKLGDRSGEGAAYNNLGYAYVNLGDYKTAIHYYERRLQRTRELGDRKGEEAAYNNLGSAHRRLKDFKTAIDYYDRCLKMTKTLGDRSGEGAAYSNLGNAYERLGDFKTAIHYYERHLKIAKELGDRSAEGASCGNIGGAHHSLGNFKTALDYHERELKIAQELGDRSGEGAAYGNLGISHRTLGDIKTAMKYHECHLKIAKEQGDRSAEGKAYGNLGNTHRSLGDFKTAIGYLERHLNIEKELGDRSGEGIAYSNLGCAHQSQGDFKTAVTYHERRLEIAKELGDRSGEGAAYANLGISYHSLGDFKTAIDYQERHLKITKELGERSGEGKAYGNLGSAHLSLGDFETAIKYIERHLEVAKELGDKTEVENANSNLGIAYDRLGDLKTAIDCHERCLKIAKELGNKWGEGKAYGQLGSSYLGLGDFVTAIDYNEWHLNISKELGDRLGEGLAYGNLGVAYRSMGDPTLAIDYQTRCLKIAKELGDTLNEGKACSDLGKSFESLGQVPKAIDYYQQGILLFNNIRDRLELKDEWKISLRDQYQTTYTALWRLLLAEGNVKGALFSAEQGRAQGLKDLVELKYAFERSGAGSGTENRTVDELLRYLPPNTIFIAFGEKELVFWVCQRGKDVELRKKQINSATKVETFFQAISQAVLQEIGARGPLKCEDRSLDLARDKSLEVKRSPQDDRQTKHLDLQKSALSTLYEIIIEPIQDLFLGSELTFVPEGQLCLAPFAAFEDSNSKYLCKSFRIRVSPSLTSLKMIVDCPVDYHLKSGVLLVGDPWVQEVTNLEELPSAREEVEMIGRTLGTIPLTGRQATKYEVLGRLGSVALVHIAAHGSMEAGEIALAPNNGEMDFMLTMKDVLSVQMRARLVVLSCCHSARGQIKAEGVVGIARAFLGAGARSVLVSLWAIDDEATLEFMKNFYQQLVKGKSASEALNQAMNCMIESEEFNAVRFWAPFVLIGDDVTLEFSEST